MRRTDERKYCSLEVVPEKVDSIDDWLINLQEGYIGIQSGNTDSFYIGIPNRDYVYHMHSGVLEKRDTRILKKRLTNTMIQDRKYWRFKSRYLLKENLTERMSDSGLKKLNSILNGIITKDMESIKDIIQGGTGPIFGKEII